MEEQYKTLFPALYDTACRLLLKGVSATAIINKLKQQGIPHATAEDMVFSIAHEYKDGILANKKKELDRVNRVAIGMPFSILCTLIAGLLHIQDLIWYLILMAISSCAAYYAYPKKPIAAITSALLAILLCPLAYHFYFADRTSYIKFEILIPSILAYIPSMGVFAFLEQRFYPNVEN